MLRVRSSFDLASRTTKGSLSITSALTSARVMYDEVSVSYSRRFGYFLITRTPCAPPCSVLGFVAILGF